LVNFVESFAEQKLQPADKILLMAQLGVQANVRGFERFALALEWQD